MNTHPSVDLVRELPRVYTATVSPDLIDENGHMNIRHYFRMQEEANIALFDDLEIGLDYPELTGHGLFTLEQHLTYVSECLLDDQISVHLGLVSITDKVLHSIGYLVNETRNSLAHVMETIVAHVDLSSRKIVPWSEQIQIELKKIAAEAPDWTPHTAGCLKTR